jgi:hypothetical protein
MMDVDSLDVFLWNDGRKKHEIQIKHRARCVKDLSSLLDNLRTVQSRDSGVCFGANNAWTREDGQHPRACLASQTMRPFVVCAHDWLVAKSCYGSLSLWPLLALLMTATSSGNLSCLCGGVVGRRRGAPRTSVGHKTGMSIFHGSELGS